MPSTVCHYNISAFLVFKVVKGPPASLLFTLKTFVPSLSHSSHSSVIFHQDGNGYIDEQELDALLKDLCDKNKMVMSPVSDPVVGSVIGSHCSPSLSDRARLLLGTGRGLDGVGRLQEEHHGSVGRGQTVPHRAGDRPLSGLHAVTSLPETFRVVLSSPRLLLPTSSCNLVHV